jgi:hypothetical protein
LAFLDDTSACTLYAVKPTIVHYDPAARLVHRTGTNGLRSTERPGSTHWITWPYASNATVLTTWPVSRYPAFKEARVLLRSSLKRSWPSAESAALAREFGVSWNVMNRAILGITWAHL